MASCGLETTKQRWHSRCFPLDFPHGPVLRIRLPMQGTQAQSQVWEDYAYHGATRPKCHNYRACALESRVPYQEKPLQSEAFTPQLENSLCLPKLEKPVWSNKEAEQPKINKIKKAEVAIGSMLGTVHHQWAEISWTQGSLHDALQPLTIA